MTRETVYENNGVQLPEQLICNFQFPVSYKLNEPNEHIEKFLLQDVSLWYTKTALL